LPTTVGLVVHLELYRRAAHTNRVEAIGDEGPVRWMVAIGEVAVQRLELGDDAEVVVPRVRAEIATERVPAHGRDELGQLGQPQFHEAQLLVGGVGTQLEEREVADHFGTNVKPISSFPSVSMVTVGMEIRSML